MSATSASQNGAPLLYPGEEDRAAPAGSVKGWLGKVLPCLSRKKEQKGFGVHDISFIGGLCLMSNNICGSAMVQIPGLFQQAGWVVSTLIFVVIAVWTTQSALLLSKTIAAMPGNAKFTERWEFGKVAQTLFPRWLYLMTVGFLVCSFIAQNVSNIIVSSQVMDDTLMATAKKTCALVIYPQSGNSPFQCVDNDSDAILTDSPFGNSYVISIGYIIVLAVTIPLSYMNLDDNIIVQILGMGLLTGCVLVWVAQFIYLGLSGALMPAFAATSQPYTSVLPTVLFNYGFVATTPSWLNEKSTKTKVTPTLVASVIIATSLYLLLGFFGALSLNFSSGQDVLSLIADGNIPGMWKVSQACTYIFPIANLMSSIPVFAVIVRYNLVNTGWLPAWAANLISVGTPWILSLFFYAGNQLNELINWSSALLFVQINLLFPVLLYLRQPALLTAERYNIASLQAPSGNASGYFDAGGRYEDPLYPDWDRIALVGRTSFMLNKDDGADSVVGEGVPERISALPVACLRWIPERKLALVLIPISILLSLAAIALQIYSEVQTDT